MSKCLNCQEETTNPKFCSRPCAATYNNRKFPKRSREREYKPCRLCGEETIGNYCCRDHQYQYQYEQYIKNWMNPDHPYTGLEKSGVVSSPVKRWLRERAGDKCELCSWDKVNPHTGKRPLVADHIDGNWRNNSPSNLRLICPNCDSLSETYKGANKGRGRTWRIDSQQDASKGG